LPDKPVKHIPVHQQPVGAKRKMKMKIQDGTTGKVSWRSGKKGFVRDYDGDAISTNYSNKDMKISHKVHGGAKGKVGKAPTDGKQPELPEE
jgi:hypothetical protein